MDTEIKGLDSFLQFLSDSPKKMQQGLHVGILAGAELIEMAAKANCPVGPPAAENVRLYGDYTGALRDSIRTTVTEKGSRVVASITAGGKTPGGADIHYAHLIEFCGAAPHVIKARSGKVLTFGGKSVKAVNHPGMRPRPFMRPALDANVVAAVGMVDQQIDEMLK